MVKLSNIVRVATWALLLGWGGIICNVPAAFAFDWIPTPVEYYLLPDYCKAKMSWFIRGRAGYGSPWKGDAAGLLMPPAEVDRWEKMVGPDFRHLHHYCLGVAHLAQADDPVARGGRSASGFYSAAVDDIAYTRDNSHPGAPLWSTMSLDYARALDGAGRVKEADATFAQVIKESPKLVDAWTWYAKSLHRRGDINGAIAVLEEGLGKVPKKGPLLYWLAIFQYDVGDFAAAEKTVEQAEAAGMKMSRLRRQLGSRKAP